MYVQPPDNGTQQASRPNVIVPKNYSGSAFRQYGRDPEAERPQPPVSPPPVNEPPPDLPQDEAPVTDLPDGDGEAIPAWKNSDKNDCEDDRHRKDDREKHGGILSRFPFLSSLRPPSRGKHKKDGILPEWVVIAAVILLFFSEDGENDILPFLLLLLLWD